MIRSKARVGAALGLGLVLLTGCGGGSAASAPPPGTGGSTAGSASAPVKSSGGVELRKYKLQVAGGSQLSVSQVSTTRWEVADAGTIHAAENVAGEIVLSVGGTEVGRGKLKGDKLKIAGSVTWEIKFRADKIKVALAPGAAPIELKIKPGKIKVKIGTQELGKVKFYPDTGKVKVKDASGAEVAVLKKFGRLSAAPGMFLAEKAGALQARDRNLVMALLFVLGK